MSLYSRCIVNSISDLMHYAVSGITLLALGKY